MSSPAAPQNASAAGDAAASTLSTKVLSMRFMQRHQEKVRSAAVVESTSKPHVSATAVAASDKPSPAGGAIEAPVKRSAPVPGRRSFGGFNPHIQVTAMHSSSASHMPSPLIARLQAHCDRLVAASTRGAAGADVPRSTQHLVDDAEQHADVKADAVAAAMGFKKPRRSKD